MAKSRVKLNRDLTKRLREYNDKWQGYWKDNNNRYSRYLEMVYSEDMWEQEDRDALKKYSKTPLSFNKLATIVNSIAGEQAQNDVQLLCIPLSDNISPQMIDIREAILKKISADSDAKMVYSSAFRQALAGGFGAFRLDHGYVSNNSFEQRVEIHSVDNPTRCFWDVSARSRAKTDGNYCGYYTYMSKELFGEKYGKKLANNLPSKMESSTDNGANFRYIDDDSICILEVYERKYKKEKIYELDDGQVVTEEELEELQEQLDETAALDAYGIMEGEEAALSRPALAPMMPTPEFGAEQEPQAMGVGNLDEQMAQNPNVVQPQQPTMEPPMEPQMPMQPPSIDPVDEREIESFTIKRYKIAGDYILEESEFPSEELPLIFVDQESFLTKTGMQVTRPFVQSAKDAQHFINYLGTQIAYLIKVSRYDQFIATRKNVEGSDIQALWRNPSQVQGALIYNPDPETGAKPEKLMPPELSQSLLTQYQRALEDIQTSTGVFATQLGAQGSEVSGAAIDARTERGNNNTYVVFDSLNNAITAAGKVINQMIPEIYDSPRNMMLEKKDVGIESTPINQPMDAYGSEVMNDVTKGEFSIKIKAGPSFEGQKDMTLKSLQMLMQAGGEQMFPMIADLVAENLPVPNNIEIKNRLKTLVPPEILQAGKTGKPVPQKPPQPDPAAMMAQAQVQLKQQELQLKQQKLQQESVQAQQKMQMEQAEIQLKYTESQARIEAEELRVAAELDRTHAQTELGKAKVLTDLIGHQRNEVRSN